VRKVRHSASAEDDLLEAWLYIAEDSVDAADRLLDQIEIETRTLLIQPEIGQKSIVLRTTPGTSSSPA
jgi:plasmid stabilization system protein ParE